MVNHRNPVESLGIHWNRQGSLHELTEICKKTMGIHRNPGNPWESMGIGSSQYESLGWKSLVTTDSATTFRSRTSLPCHSFKVIKSYTAHWFSQNNKLVTSKKKLTTSKHKLSKCGNLLLLLLILGGLLDHVLHDFSKPEEPLKVAPKNTAPWRLFHIKTSLTKNKVHSKGT